MEVTAGRCIVVEHRTEAELPESTALFPALRHPIHPGKAHVKAGKAQELLYGGRWSFRGTGLQGS